MKSAEIYDPKTGKFTAASPMNDSRFKLPDEAVQLATGRLLIAGGSSQAEIYDPAAGKFVVAPGGIGKPWHFMTETRLQDGRVLLAGGYANDPEATGQTWILSAVKRQRAGAVKRLPESTFVHFSPLVATLRRDSP